MTDQLQLLQNEVHARSIAGLRNFFSNYFTVRKELNLDQSADSQRSLPEFFLTFHAGRTNDKLALHILFQNDTPKKDELEKKLKEYGSTYLSSNLVVPTFHDSEARETLYRDFKSSGVTYYLNPAAIRALSQVPVAGDAYGLYHLTALWLHVLAFLLFLLLALALWDWFFVLSVPILLLMSYVLFSAIGNLPPLRKAFSGQRRRLFASILAECQIMGRQAIDADLSVEVPHSLLDKLNQLPPERPKPADVLMPEDWRLGEIWDLAHRSINELTKTPESSPDFPFRVDQVDKLLDKALLAFNHKKPDETEADPIEELYAQVSLHAAALGVRAVPETVQPIPLPQKVR